MFAACEHPPEHASLQPQAVQVADALPQPPDQSVDEQKLTEMARQTYVSCLNRAARYADNHLQSSSDVATVVAPMCYAQFEEFEAAAEVGMSRRDTQLDIRHGDQQQTELAEQAVKRERSQAALSTSK